MTRVNEVLDRGTHPDGVHRDQWTRPIYPVPDDPDGLTKCKACDAKVHGRPYTRMTRFIDVLGDKFALERWFQRQVLKGVVLKEHLVLKAANALNPDDPQAEKAALDRVCRDAAEAAGSGDTADKGTELHRTIERIMRGEKVRVPAAFRADVEALHQQLTAHRLEPRDMEVNIVIDGVRVQKTAWGIGGRFDVLLAIPAPCPVCGCALRVGDFKTGQVWYHGCDQKRPCDRKPADCPRRTMYGADEFRMQLAGYASGHRIDPTTGVRTELGVCQCWGYVIHLPAGEGVCEILEVDLERGRAGLREAYQLWLWRSGNHPLGPAPLPDIPTSTDPGPAVPPADGVAGPDTPPSPAPVAPARSTETAGADPIHGQLALASDQNQVLAIRDQYQGNGWAYGHELHAWQRYRELEGEGA